MRDGPSGANFDAAREPHGAGHERRPSAVRKARVVAKHPVGSTRVPIEAQAAQRCFCWPAAAL